LFALRSRLHSFEALCEPRFLQVAYVAVLGHVDVFGTAVSQAAYRECVCRRGHHLRTSLLQSTQSVAQIGLWMSLKFVIQAPNQTLFALRGRQNRQRSVRGQLLSQSVHLEHTCDLCVLSVLLDFSCGETLRILIGEDLPQFVLHRTDLSGLLGAAFFDVEFSRGSQLSCAAYKSALGLHCWLYGDLREDSLRNAGRASSKAAALDLRRIVRVAAYAVNAARPADRRLEGGPTGGVLASVTVHHRLQPD